MANGGYGVADAAAAAERAGSADSPFTEQRARGLLAAAGLPGLAADAELVALGENAVFSGQGLVAKVGRDPELLPRATRELRVAHWLAERGIPAVRAAEPEVRTAEGRPVTVWHRLPQPLTPAPP
ncbi:hypothetical protein ADK38_38210, partial [Streptomyces varsoviensis]